MPKTPEIRAIEEAASLQAAQDGKSSPAERYAIRAQLRAAAGMPPEKKKRGGAAGLYDRNKNTIIPIAAGALGLLTGGVATPMLATAAARGLDREGQGGIGFDAGQAVRGAAEGGMAGSVGKFVGGMLPSAAQAAGSVGAVPAASGAASTAGAAGAAGAGALPPVPAAGGFLGGLKNAAGHGLDWLKADGGTNALKLAAGVGGVLQQTRGNQIMADAAKADSQRWAYGAPLREAGRAGLMAGVPGNPFAPTPAQRPR